MCRNRNVRLDIFKESTDDYDLWHDRQLDHISSQCSMWNRLLESTEIQPNKMDCPILETTNRWA